MIFQLNVIPCGFHDFGRCFRCSEIYLSATAYWKLKTKTLKVSSGSAFRDGKKYLLCLLDGNLRQQILHFS